MQVKKTLRKQVIQQRLSVCVDFWKAQVLANPLWPFCGATSSTSACQLPVFHGSFSNRALMDISQADRVASGCCGCCDMLQGIAYNIYRRKSYTIMRVLEVSAALHTVSNSEQLRRSRQSIYGKFDVAGIL